MVTLPPTARLNQYIRISRLLAGQLDFGSAIRAVAAEIAQIVPHDHLDVCIVGLDGKFHTAYESGIDTHWGNMPHAPIANSPIKAVLTGEVDHLLTDDACSDPRFRADEVAYKPIFQHGLRSRIHLPMRVHGEIIGALSCSLHEAGRYGPDDLRNARYIAEMLSPYFFALRATDQARQSAIVEAEARAREEGLRLGALKLTQALEQERQRIGMDLHDQTLADLTRIARRLDRLTGTGPVPPKDIAQVIGSLQQSMASLRHIIEEAQPTVLQLFGFGEAIENHLDRAIRDAGQGSTWSLKDQTNGAIDNLPPAVAIALFRITQEAVNNAVSHAEASRVTVEMTMTQDEIGISVADDGIGFDVRRARGGSGLENMRTRARLISARFMLRSVAAERGTTVGIWLPVVSGAAKGLSTAGAAS